MGLKTLFYHRPNKARKGLYKDLCIYNINDKECASVKTKGIFCKIVLDSEHCFHTEDTS